MLDGKCLVIGASGFLGSHVVKALCAGGNDVRILVRETSDTQATDRLDIERRRGSPFDREFLLDAVDGVDYVFYCVVDTRSWLRDTAPLWDTNVEKLKLVLETLSGVPLKKFVFTSSFVTIGLNDSGVASEADAFNWDHKAPDYIKTRVAAERMVLAAGRAGRLPAVACNVSNTYGPEDYAPTPHGRMLLDAALGRLPFYFDGGAESVGIEDAARGLICAAERGQPGERYIISERYVSMRELFTLAAQAAGNPPPKLKLPLAVMYTLAVLLEVMTFCLGRDNRLSVSSVRMLTMIKRVDSSKARRELGWEPRPIEDSVAAAVRFYQDYAKTLKARRADAKV